MAQKRINQLDEISNDKMLNTDIFVIDRINNGGTYKTYKINGQQIINGILAAIPSQQSPAYILDTNTNSIKANYPSTVATVTGEYSYASGHATVNGDYSFGHGNNITITGNNSAGLGGSDYNIIGHNIVVLGGARNSNTYSDDNTVYVPYLNIENIGQDDNLEHILVRNSTGTVSYRDVNTIAGSGGGMISKTYIDLMSDKTGGILVPGTTYYIIDRDIWLLALSTNELSLAGQRKYKIVKNDFYDKHGVPDGSITHLYLGMYGKEINKGAVLNSTASTVYYVIWGGRMWKRNSSGADVPGTSDEIIDGGWTMELTSNDGFYEDKIFDVLYDFDNDIIIEQSDNNGNIVRTDNQNHINITDWGNNDIKNNITGGIFNNYSNIINNNIVKQTISNNSNTGDKISDNTSGSISNNSNTGDIDKNVLSIIHNISNNSNAGAINNNSNIGAINNNSNTGGIISNSNSKAIYQNTNSGEISNNSNTGFIGYNSNNGFIGGHSNNVDNIEHNSNNGNINDNDNVGDIKHNSNNGDIKGNKHNVVAIYQNINSGEIGNNSNNGFIGNNSNNGNIFSNNNVGEISSNSNEGYIKGNSNNGGIIGNFNSGDIDGNSNVGDISNNSNIGSINNNAKNNIINGNSNNGNIIGNFNSNGNIEGNSNNGDIIDNSNEGEISGNKNNGYIAEATGSGDIIDLGTTTYYHNYPPSP